MSERITVVYLGPLDDYTNEASGVTLARGVPVAVSEKDAKWLLIQRRNQPRSIFRDGEPAIEKERARLDAEYLRYPDMVIKHYRKHAATYQQHADSAQHEDPKKERAIRAGALSEVHVANQRIYDHMLMKAERQCQPYPGSFEDIFPAFDDSDVERVDESGADFSGVEPDDPFANLKPKRGRKPAAVA